jgi:hypothetical protein
LPVASCPLQDERRPPSKPVILEILRSGRV